MVIEMWNWAVISAGGDDYTAPECRSNCLHGDIESHPELLINEENKTVTTSAIVKVKGRKVTTYSGREYILRGPPFPQFKKFLAEKNMPYLPHNPLKPLVEANYLKG